MDSLDINVDQKLNIGVLNILMAETNTKTSFIEVSLVIDTSGSMSPCMQLLQTSLHKIINYLANINLHISLSITSFNDDAKTIIPMTIITDENILYFQETITHLRAYGQTNLSKGLELGQAQFTRLESTTQEFILLITDGYANMGEQQPDKLIQMIDTNVNVYACALGNLCDCQFLQTFLTQRNGLLTELSKPDYLGQTIGGLLGTLLSVVSTNTWIKIIHENQIISVKGTWSQHPSGKIRIGPMYANQLLTIVFKLPFIISNDIFQVTMGGTGLKTNTHNITMHMNTSWVQLQKYREEIGELLQNQNNVTKQIYQNWHDKITNNFPKELNIGSVYIRKKYINQRQLLLLRLHEVISTYDVQNIQTKIKIARLAQNEICRQRTVDYTTDEALELACPLSRELSCQGYFDLDIPPSLADQELNLFN